MQASRRRFASRVGLLPQSAIREMTRLADLNGAINLSQGYPDFPAPAGVKAAASRAIKQDHNQYEVTSGSPELRDAIAAKARKVNGIQATGEDNVTVTCGATEAVAAAVLALTDSNDTVLVPEPFYECYLGSAVLSGARISYYPLTDPGFRLDEEALKEAFSSDPKVIILNSPNNPTGRVFTKEELGLVADLCAEHGTIAITDEIYERIVFDGRRHISLATLGDMADSTVTISGISKTYSVTGWRIGYTIAEKGLTEGIRKVHDFLTVCAPAPLQKAALAAFKLPASYYSGLTKSYTRKRDLLRKSLEDAGFACSPPEGSYFIMADFSEIWKGDDYSFAQHLVEDGGVACVPASSFYASKGKGKTKVRFAFPKKDETLREAAKRIKARV